MWNYDTIVLFYVFVDFVYYDRLFVIKQKRNDFHFKSL